MRTWRRIRGAGPRARQGGVSARSWIATPWAGRVCAKVGRASGGRRWWAHLDALVGGGDVPHLHVASESTREEPRPIAALCKDDRVDARLGCEGRPGLACVGRVDDRLLVGRTDGEETADTQARSRN